MKRTCMLWNKVIGTDIRQCKSQMISVNEEIKGSWV